ncbi:hypothetical protein L1I30_09420 [Gillisia sp. M10.2A]|uniref:Lipoprotein n=1 Tax=Gillisia lutea TaxID=2909668 RepID=A0ABS9EG73_9FLAO|nr:hypothetical protein [Gillisia lutea]MCF4101885.1 hypothetical protein [Gillisia lutea]
MNINHLLLLLLLAFLTSCGNSSDKKKVTIDDFNKKFEDSLVPIPDKNYSVFYAKIKGNSNDTIRLSISPIKTENPKKYYYFIGDFEKEIRSDYYGESNKYITLDPYKATEGKIELKYQL